MNTVSFSDVSSIFNSANVWLNGHAEYWYRYAWDTLTELGKTSYETEIERYRIFLYALTISYVYDEFCGYAFEEEDNFYYPDLIADEVPDVVIGQILCEHITQDECIDDVEEALNCILDDMKYEVFKALKQRLSETEIFVWMYCTGCTPTKLVCDDDEDITYEEDEYEINSYDDYVLMITKEFEDVVNDEINDSTIDAFNYLCTIM